MLFVYIYLSDVLIIICKYIYLYHGSYECELLTWTVKLHVEICRLSCQQESIHEVITWTVNFKYKDCWNSGQMLTADSKASNNKYRSYYSRKYTLTTCQCYAIAYNSNDASGHSSNEVTILMIRYASFVKKGYWSKWLQSTS